MPRRRLTRCGGRGQVSADQARRETARVGAAHEIPGVADALSSGETTGEHVDVLARAWARLDDEQRNRFDTELLLSEAQRLPVETYRRLVKRHTDTAIGDHGLTDTLARRQRSEFRHWYDHGSGMGRFTGALDPERYETLCNAIEHHMTTLAGQGGEPVSKDPALAATALVDLVTGQSRRGGLPSITVIIDEQTLRTGPHDRSVTVTENAHHLPPETVSRLCCDATLRRVVFDERRVPIDVGRKHRTATDAQWAALKAMHSTCAWDRCDTPIAWCQAHHILEWEHNGATNLDNLVPLCNQHHHHVHEGRWKIVLAADRTLHIHRPDGTRQAVVRPVGRRRIPAAANAPP